jgi:hypothetical protein
MIFSVEQALPSQWLRRLLTRPLNRHVDPALADHRRPVDTARASTPLTFMATQEPHEAMYSLMHQVDAAPVDAFLSATDQVMNSNTLLLRAGVHPLISRANGRAVLEALVRSPLFAETMRSADHARGWDNLQEDRIPAGEATLHLTELSEAGLHARLSWMLSESFSPYQRHLASAQAGALVSDFLRWLHQPDLGSGEFSDWSYWSVRPDFLPTTGYYTGDQSPPGTAYFDGGPNDTATYMYRDRVLMLLLTNGCP